ncbi:MAG: hypothetical protein JNL98_12145 [Bryobacterales bacterium]|nr:hypothetical protein [Bryobacterales bacterium]
MIRFSLILVFLASGNAVAQGIIETYAGTDWSFGPLPARAVDMPLAELTAMAGDVHGNLYFAAENRIFRVNTDGIAQLIAGNGLPGYSGDGGDARNASIGLVESIAVDATGNVYFRSAGVLRIRVIRPDFNIRTFAGTGERRPDADLALPPMPALEATFSDILSIAADSTGSLYVAEPLLVRKIGTDGVIRTFAGGGDRAPNEGVPALEATLRPPVAGFSGNYAPLLVDPNDRLILWAGYRVIAIGQDGIMKWIAGTGRAGTRLGATARESDLLIRGFAAGADGSIYISNLQFGVRILAVTEDGLIRSVAGNSTSQSSGDGGAATEAGLGQSPRLLAVAGSALHLDDRLCYCVRRIDSSGIINRYAGNGLLSRPPEGASKEEAHFLQPLGLALDREQNLYVASRGLVVSALSGGGSLVPVETAGRIEQISRAGQYQHLAGGFGGSGPKNVRLSGVTGILVDPGGRPVFGADLPSQLLRLESDGNLSQIWRGGMLAPITGHWRGLLPDTEQGSYLIATGTSPRQVRRLSADGTSTVIAGDGRNGFFGDGGPAVSAGFREPHALAYNAAGELLITDVADHRVRKIDRAGIITTICGNGTAGSTGDGGPATNATLNAPSGIAVDNRGRIYILERDGHRIRMIDERGIIQTIAGTGEPGYSGDGGLSTRARIDGPDMGIAIAPNGDIYFSDTGNQRIRVIRAPLPVGPVSRVRLPVQAGQGQISRVPLPALQLPTNMVVTVRSRTTGGNWLSVTPAVAPTPVQLQATLDASALPPGTYNGVISVLFDTSVLLEVDVVLTVTPATPGRLLVPTQPVSSSLEAGATETRDISLVNEGGQALPVTISLAVDGSARWLSATPASATLGPGERLPLNLRISAMGLGAGTYSGSVLVQGGGQQVRVPVALVVKQAARPSVVVSQAGLTFVAVAKGGAPAPQSVGILNEGTGEMTWQARASTLGGGNWLAVDTESGRVARPLQDVAQLAVSVDHRNLERGDYYGRVEITVPGGSPQVVTVLLRVLAEGSPQPPEVRPTGLIFIGAPGANPGSQSVTVSNLRAAPVSFFSYRGTEDGRQWFTQLPSIGSVQPNAPARIAVQPDFAGLEPGIRRGGLSLQFGDVIQSVNVLSIVAPPGTQFDAKGLAGRALAGCASKNIQIQFTSLRDGFEAAVGEPLTVEVKMVDDCGTLLTPQTAPGAKPVAYIANRGQITLNHIGAGLWTGTLKPTAASSTPVDLNVAVNVENRLSVGGRSGTIRELSRTPIVQSGSLRHSASFITGAPVAPGQLISILGGNLADRESRVNAPPFPQSLDETEVLLGGRPLPLLFTSTGQINAQIPYDLASDVQHQVVVRRGNTLSVPEQFVVAQAQPGIFTVNEQGFGQGFIRRADGRVADAANPARRGDTVVILCTGLGLVTPLLPPGAPAPPTPPTVVAPVQAAIGGRTAIVVSATLDPGSAGRYRVQVTVPADSPLGSQIPVVITAAGRSSEPVTMAVQ